MKNALTITYRGKPLTTTFGESPMKTLSVSVTQDIVESAQPCNFNKCMVAEAIQQKYPDATHVYVDTSSIRFTRHGLRYYFLPPQPVKDFIVKYDRHEAVKAFNFVATFLARVMPSGFYQTHPKGDNRTNPNKRYLKSEKKRKYANKVRINGVCQFVPVAA